MDKVYLIEKVDEFYENCRTPLGFALTEQEVKERVNKLEDRKKCINEWIKKVYNLEKVMDDSEVPVYKDIPNWKAGIKQDEITTEMREERDSIKAHNKKLKEGFYEKVKEVRRRVQESMLLDLSKTDIPEDDKKKIINRESIYSTYEYSILNR